MDGERVEIWVRWADRRDDEQTHGDMLLQGITNREVAQTHATLPSSLLSESIALVPFLLLLKCNYKMMMARISPSPSSK